MKSFFLMLCVCAIATGASAGSIRQETTTSHLSPAGMISGNAKTYERALPDQNFVKKQDYAKPLRVTTDDLPEGITKVYSTNWICLFTDYVVDNTGIASVIHFAENSQDVYFYDFFGQGKDYWLAATISEDGIISIPMHQYAYDDPTFGPLTIELSHFQIGDDTMTSIIDTDATDYKLVLGDDGVIRSTDLDQEWSDRHYPLLTSEYGGTFGLVGSIVMTEVKDKLVTPPAGIEPQVYSYSYTKNFDTTVSSGFCNVIDTGEDVYVQGMSPSLADIWLKGTYSPDHKQLIFKSGQYLGFDIYVHYFHAAHRETKEIDGEWREVWVKDPELVLNVSDDGQTFTFDNTSYFAITIAGDVDYVFAHGKLSPYKEEAAIPAAPTNLELIWIEVDALSFIQPVVDINGNALNSDNLSWRMYINEKLFTFDPSEYQYLEAPTNTLPYCFDDGHGYDFFSYYGNDQIVALYDNSFLNIGVQSVYTVNGVENVSGITYLGYTGIENASADKSEIVSSEYFDLMGNRIAHPDKGFYIRVDTKADGSKVSVKTIH